MQCCISLSLSDAINSLLITYQAVSVFHLTRQLVYILLIHTDIASTSLAAGQTTSWIQDGQLGIPSAVKQSTYLSSDDIHLTSENSACSLRSSSERKCSVTRVHSRFGDIYFAAAGPRIWNNLPASLRDKEVSCTEFRRQLKTSMFQTDCGASWLSWLLHLINTLTYLLTYLLTDLLTYIMSGPKSYDDSSSVIKLPLISKPHITVRLCTFGVVLR